MSERPNTPMACVHVVARVGLELGDSKASKCQVCSSQPAAIGFAGRAGGCLGKPREAGR